MSGGTARLLASLTPPSKGSSFRIGDILEAGRSKLRISCDGLVLEPDDLWLAPGLTYHWIADTGDPSFLRAGERVLLLSLDDQDYYLVSKAVKA